MTTQIIIEFKGFSQMPLKSFASLISSVRLRITIFCTVSFKCVVLSTSSTLAHPTAVNVSFPFSLDGDKQKTTVFVLLSSKRIYSRCCCRSIAISSLRICTRREKPIFISGLKNFVHRTGWKCLGEIFCLVHIFLFSGLAFHPFCRVSMLVSTPPYGVVCVGEVVDTG